MKRVAVVVVVSLCCGLVASSGFAFCKGGRQAEVTINMDFSSPGSPILTFGDKISDPIPCIYRGGEIEVTVNFISAPASQEVILRDFRALIHALPPNAGGGSWISDFEESSLLEIQEFNGTVWNTVTELEFDSTTSTRTIKLEGQRQPGGPRRLISYQLELAKGTGGGNPVEVIFDPPWGERP